MDLRQKTDKNKWNSNCLAVRGGGVEKSRVFPQAVPREEDWSAEQSQNIIDISENPIDIFTNSIDISTNINDILSFQGARADFRVRHLRVPSAAWLTLFPTL